MKTDKKKRKHNERSNRVHEKYIFSNFIHIARGTTLDTKCLRSRVTTMALTGRGYSTSRQRQHKRNRVFPRRHAFGGRE